MKPAKQPDRTIHHPIAVGIHTTRHVGDQRDLCALDIYTRDGILIQAPLILTIYIINAMTKSISTLFIAFMLCGCASTNRDWQEANRSGTIEAYEKFLQAHSKTDQANEAQGRIQELRADQDWVKTQSTNTIPAYQAFLAQYPNAKQADKAKMALKALESKADWTRAQSLGTIKAYSEFLQKHPRSKEAVNAKQSLERLETERDWTSARTANSIIAYQEYLQKHDTMQYASEARQRLSALQEAQTWTMALQSNTDDAYLDFIKKYPKSSQRETALNKLKNYQVAMDGRVIPWTALGGRSIVVDEKHSNTEGASLSNATVVRLPGIPTTINCTDDTEVRFPNWVKLGSVLCIGQLKASSEGMRVIKGTALIPVAK